MGDFIKSAFGYFGSGSASKTENDFVGQYIEVGTQSLRVKKVLAEGGFAVVYEAQDNSNNKEYALKRLLSHDEETSKNILHEIAVLKRLSGHPNIIQFISAASVGKEKSRHIGTEFLIVTELCKGGELISLMRAKGNSFPAKLNAMIFYQTCKALQHMHKQDPPIIHRDLKVENLLISNKGIIKLCDFGSCTTQAYYPDKTWSALRRGEVTEELEKNTTPMYRTPEMLDLYQNFPINEAADIWAMGCVLYMLCFYAHPFEDSAKLAILNANYTISQKDSQYKIYHQLIRNMLTIDPTKRPQINEIIGEMHEIGSALETKLTGPIPFDPELRKKIQISIDERESVRPSEQTTETPHHPSRPPPPSATPPRPHNAPQRPPPAAMSQQTRQPSPTPHTQPAGGGGGGSAQQSAAGMFGMFKGGAGNLMKNIKDASSKVMETVSASINKSDLDITYITTRIIVMSYPADGGLETLARNHIDDVQAFLDTRHPQVYAVYNVSQRQYRGEKFSGRLSHRGFDPSQAPPLAVLFELCENMLKWLSEGKRNVCVIHCMDGKAASALIVSALFCFCHLFDNPSPAVQLFCTRRGNPNLNSSQLRYVNYVCKMVGPDTVQPHHKPVMLLNITVSPIPQFNRTKTGCRPYVEVYQGDKKIYSSIAEYETMRVYSMQDEQISVPLNGVSATGDVTIILHHARSSFANKGKISSVKICQAQFHTGFITENENKLNFSRETLDTFETADKYSDKFQLSVDIVVSPTDKPRPSNAPSFPWMHLPEKLMRKDILFNDREEMNTIMNDFCRYNVAAKSAAGGGMGSNISDSDETSSNDSSPETNRRSKAPTSSAPYKDFNNKSSTAPPKPDKPPNFFSALDWSDTGPTNQSDSNDWMGNEGPDKKVSESGFGEDDDFSDFLAARQTSQQPAVAKDKVADLLGFGDEETDLEQSSMKKDLSNFDLLSSSGANPPLDTGAAQPSREPDLLQFGGSSASAWDDNEAFDPFANLSSAATSNASPKAPANPSAGGYTDPFASLSQGGKKSQDLLRPNLPHNSNSTNSLSSMGNNVNDSAPNSNTNFDPFADFDNLFSGQKPKSMTNLNKESTSSPKRTTSPAVGSGYNLAAPGGAASTKQRCPSPAPDKTASANYSRDMFNNASSTTSQSSSNTGAGSGIRAKVEKNAFEDLLGDAFGSGGKSSKEDGGPKTIKEMRREIMAKETDPDKMKVLEWVEGKERNIRALLCSLHTMLWDGVRWNGVNMSELVGMDHVKRQYKNAVRAIHPDKWYGTEYEKISKMIVIELNDAMTEFENQKEAAASSQQSRPMF